MSEGDALKWQAYTTAAWMKRRGAPPPVEGSIEVLDEVDPDAPVVEGEIVP